MIWDSVGLKVFLEYVLPPGAEAQQGFGPGVFDPMTFDDAYALAVEQGEAGKPLLEELEKMRLASTD